MNISQRLRTCARHTGLDAVIELLNEAADEIERRSAAQPAEVTDERGAFEACEVMAGSLFKRRADDPEKYWDGNVQDDWELWQARAILTRRPVQVPMTADQVWHNDALMSANGTAGFKMDALMRIVRAAESHHGITAQAKKESA